MTQKATLQAVFALLVTGCTVNVSNPNIGSKNNVTANADVRATVVSSSAPARSPIPTADPSRSPKPDYAVLEGDLPFVQDEIDRMLAAKLLSQADLNGLSEVERLKGLKPETRAHIRSKQIERWELLILLESVPIDPQPTPTPTPGPSTQPSASPVELLKAAALTAQSLDDLVLALEVADANVVAGGGGFYAISQSGPTPEAQASAKKLRKMAHSARAKAIDGYRALFTALGVRPTWIVDGQGRRLGDITLPWRFKDARTGEDVERRCATPYLRQDSSGALVEARVGFTDRTSASEVTSKLTLSLSPDGTYVGQFTQADPLHPGLRPEWTSTTSLEGNVSGKGKMGEVDGGSSEVTISGSLTSSLRFASSSGKAIELGGSDLEAEGLLLAKE